MPSVIEAAPAAAEVRRSPSAAPIVQITALRKSYGSNEVLKCIDLNVRRGEVIAIIGKSGSGKSTLMHLLALVDPSMDRTIRADRTETPAVIMVVGVNGTGKTTTVGKLARVLVAEDKDVLLGAADTFRAAAVEQLATWGERVGVPAVRGAEGSDPASVAFEAVRAGIEREADVVLVDTAGRLQNKAGLMDELGKVKRVIEKQLPVTEVLLVIDATTGQNGLIQARVFSEVVDVTEVERLVLRVAQLQHDLPQVSALDLPLVLAGADQASVLRASIRIDPVSQSRTDWFARRLPSQAGDTSPG